MAMIDEAVIIGDGEHHRSIDIVPVTSDPVLFAEACNDMYQMFEREVFDTVIASESSGTLFASVVAEKTRSGVVVAGSGRGSGIVREYENHHGSRAVRFPEGIVKSGTKVVIVADVLRSGKDIRAIIDIVEACGGIVVKLASFVEDSDFKARKTVLRGYPLQSRILTKDY